MKNKRGYGSAKSGKYITCQICGKSFYIPRNKFEVAIYCSKKCMYIGFKQRSGAIRKCKYCKKEFYARGNPKDRRHCSRRCAGMGRRIGRYIKCELCGKEVYKAKVFLKPKHHFCSIGCANKFQGRNKLIFVCKICSKEFKRSKSILKDRNPLYCSWSCRLKDKEHLKKNAINGNIAQQEKEGLNKLELKGREILQKIGVKFREQVLMFDKFLVDILILNKKLIIQWDGSYWHNKPKRSKLDISQDAYLKKCGYKVLRITDKQIKNDLEKVYAIIRGAI